MFSISLLCWYQDLCNSETNEVYVFLLGIYSVCIEQVASLSITLSKREKSVSTQFQSTL
jgi:hypothetical protein